MQLGEKILHQWPQAQNFSKTGWDACLITLQFREMSIPGTHGSGTAGTAVFFENQEWNFVDQIRGGIRAFDPRPQDVYQDCKKNITEGIIPGGSQSLTPEDSDFYCSPDLGEWTVESALLGSPLTMTVKKRRYRQYRQVWKYRQACAQHLS